MYCQWVVACRPSSTPAAASAKAPVQIDTTRLPRSCASAPPRPISDLQPMARTGCAACWQAPACARLAGRGSDAQTDQPVVASAQVAIPTSLGTGHAAAQPTAAAADIGRRAEPFVQWLEEKR
jgi:hypothetical protein